LRFPPESLQRLIVFCYFIGQEFECDELMQAYVLGLIDDIHPAAAEFFEDAKVHASLAEKWLGIHHCADIRCGVRASQRIGQTRNG